MGESHEKTKDSSELLKRLTEEAVKFQKTMNQITKGHKIEKPSIQVSFKPNLLMLSVAVFSCVHGYIVWRNYIRGVTNDIASL